MAFRRVLPSCAIAAMLALSACGSDAPALELSDAGQRGFDIARSNGCAACHGSQGEGGVGPAFVGLFGSERELEDELEPVIADREYLARSIADPQAQRVAGFRLQMPANGLSPEQIESVVDYIVELADAGAEE